MKNWIRKICCLLGFHQWEDPNAFKGMYMRTCAHCDQAFQVFERPSPGNLGGWKTAKPEFKPDGKGYVRGTHGNWIRII